MNTESIVQCYCNNCGRSTDHLLLQKCVVEDADEYDGDGPPFWWTDTYEMFQCRGCSAVCLRHFTKDAAGDETEAFYPPPVLRRAPLWRWHLPVGMKELLNEIYVALYSDSRRLALMGARTLVDMLMLEEVGDIGTFDAKLKALRDKASYPRGTVKCFQLH